MQGNSLSSSKGVIDLNCAAAIRSAVSSRRWRHEQWTELVFATHWSLAPARVSPMCATLRRQLSGAEFFLLGPVSRDGVCAAELPGNSAGHRRLPRLVRTPAVSSGNPRPDLAQHAGRCQRVARLADLRRLRSGIDPGSSPTLSRRRLGSRARQHGLRAGFDHHRSVYRLVPLGLFHPQTACPEIAHLARSARADSGFSAYYSGPSARCQHARPADSGSWSLLRDGSWLPQLRTAASLDLAWRFLCHSGPQELSFCPAPFSSGRQEQRRAVRSDHCSALVLFRQRLSRPAPSYSLLGCSTGKAPGVSHQQLRSSRTRHCRAVPPAMARRTVFQMDQTTSADQGFLRNFGKRCEDSGVDCSLQLPAGGHRPQTAWSATQSVHNAANSQRLPVRENTDKSSFFTQPLAFFRR